MHHYSIEGPTRSFSSILFSQRWKYNQLQKHSILNKLRQWTELKIIILSCQYVSIFFMHVVKAAGSCKQYASYEWDFQAGATGLFLNQKI